MPLDVRGCTRATLKASACALSVPCLKRLGNPLNRLRAWDRDLQLSPLNEEFPVGASHQLASITSLPFVHTARRYYRSNDFARYLDRHLPGRRLSGRAERRVCRERDQAWSFRGSKSRNKVSVGEPAEGSFPYLPSHRAQGRRLFRELRPRLSRPCPVRPGARRTSRTPFEGRRVEIPCTPGRLYSGLLRVDGLFSLSVYLSLSPSFESV